MPIARLDVPKGIANRREEDMKTVRFERQGVMVQTEGPHFSFGSDLREWTHKNVNWFRTSIAEGNLSYRAIEALRHPAAQGDPRLRRDL